MTPSGGDSTSDPPPAAEVAEPLPFGRLLGYADAADWVLMGLGTVGSVVHGMAQPVGYFLLGKALDAYGANINDEVAMVPALEKVIPYVWYMAIATLPAGMLEISCWMYTSERQLGRLRMEFIKAVLNQDIEAFDTQLTTGKIITGMSSHMNIIQDAIGEKLGHFISCFSTFLAGIMIAMICCWQVAMLAFLVVPLILVIGASYTAKMNKILSLRMTYLSQATSIVEQTLSQIKTVYSFVGESGMIKRFTKCMEEQLMMGKKEAAIKGLGMGIFQTITFWSWALIVWIGAFAVAAGKSKGGETIAAVMSILFGAISITYAAPDLQIFHQAKSAGSEVFGIIARKPKISSERGGEKSEKMEGNIEIKDVHFAYPSRRDKTILQGFSLSIPRGNVVALVGSSGCGKSTVISLVQRFYDPLSGGIFIDGHDIRELDVRFLRGNIATVSQEPSLFSGTIADNLKVGKFDATEKEIIEAATAANAHSFISKLPNQYSTEVGERGLQLSGGQKQRVAIARTILKDPPILLLDEATSALDSISERLVQDALEKAMQGRSVILIAHRMSTILNSDIIVVVEDGRVSHTGTHHELLRTSEFYSSLFEAQSLTSSEMVDSSRNMDIIEEPPNFSKKASPEDPWFSKQSKERLKDTAKQEKKERKAGASFFKIWFKLKRFDYLKIAIGSCAAAVSGVSKPVFGFCIISIGVAYYGDDPIKEVGRYSGLFSLVGLLTLFSNVLQHYFYTVVGEKAMKNLRESLFSAILRNEIAWFEKAEHAVGFVTSHVISDTSMIKSIISDRMSMIVQCFCSILIATIVSMVVNWRMALVAWAVMPCHFVGGLIQAKSAKGFGSNSNGAHQLLISLAAESTSSIRTIASFTYEESVVKKAKLLLKEPLTLRRVESVKYGFIQGISLCLWNIAHAVALWYTTHLVKKNQASFKDGIRSYQIFSLTVPSITELWTLIPMVISAINILRPAFMILDHETQIPPDAGLEPAADDRRMNGVIRFENISFSYPSRPQLSILSCFNLSIEANQSVALVGPSGAGKSSILALLLRFYEAQEGNIFVDSKNIKDYNLRWLRKQIGLVQQEPLLFSSSIRDNICYGNEGASESEIIEAATQASIHEFISSLPHGYNTLVGEKGSQLSGGQKQRIAIARTLLKRPQVLLLDEATSALDGETERGVMNALRSMKDKVTQVLVAHRLSTVINSDVIVVMNQGKVVEMGNHGTLIAERGGVYSRLFSLQSQALVAF